MTMFDYAQSNSLLKKEVGDRPAKKGSPPGASPASSVSASAASAAANAPNDDVSKKIPRCKLDGSDDNDGIQEEGPPLKKKARNDSPGISSQASKNASADTDMIAMKTIFVEKSVSAAATAGPTSASTAASTTTTNKEEKIPAKTIVHAKHKLANDAAVAAAKPNTAAGTAPTAFIQHQSETQAETVTPLSGTTTIGPSGSDDPAQTDVAKKPRKSRIRKPRRVIPNEKEYIPADEQPTQSDVVGGRGGESCTFILYEKS